MYRIITNKKRIFITFSLTVLCSFSLVFAQSFLYFQDKYDIGVDNPIEGEIGLRQYFDSSQGELEDPFVITRPSHLYNLSRLQGLGAFSSMKCFQVGKKVTVDSKDYCYVSSKITLI